MQPPPHSTRFGLVEETAAPTVRFASTLENYAPIVQPPIHSFTRLPVGVAQNNSSNTLPSSNTTRKKATPSSRIREAPRFVTFTHPSAQISELNTQPYVVPEVMKSVLVAESYVDVELPIPASVNAKNSNIPRAFTSEEVEYLVSAVTRVPSAVDEIGYVMRDQIRNVLRTELTDSELKLAPAELPKLFEIIRLHYVYSLVESGKTIGVATAEAYGQPVTQMTLKSFHFTGSMKVATNGVQAIREMFNISLIREHTLTTLHFVNKHLTPLEVLRMRYQIIGTNLKDVVVSHELRRNSLHGSYTSPDELRWWYRVHRALFPRVGAPLDPTNYLRLKVNRGLMQAANITYSDIAKALECSYVACYVHPNKGYVDVYLAAEPATTELKKVLHKRSVKYAAYATVFEKTTGPILYFSHVLLEQLRDIELCGASGIRDLMPCSVPVMSLFLHSQCVETTHPTLRSLNANDSLPEGYEYWQIWVHLSSLMTQGIPMSKLQDLLELPVFGLHSIYVPRFHENKLTNLPEGPRNFILVAWSTADRQHWERELKTTQNVLIARVRHEIAEVMKRVDVQERSGNIELNLSEEDDLIYRHAHYVYADAMGINMPKILMNPLIDPNYVTCNNPHDTLAAFGIENTRNMYMREMYDIISRNGAHISPCYSKLLADFVTNQGFLIQITSRGVARQSVGPLALASFEYAMKFFNQASMFALPEKTASTSTSIFVGTRAPIGTGSIEARPNLNKLREYRQRKDAEHQKESQAATNNLFNQIAEIGALSLGNTDLLDNNLDVNVIQFGDDDLGDSIMRMHDTGFVEPVFVETLKPRAREGLSARITVPAVKFAEISPPSRLLEILSRARPVNKPAGSSLFLRPI